jgi:hypothetical protein
MIPQHKFCLLFDTSFPNLKTNELHQRITVSEITDKCMTIIRFFPDYLNKWDDDRKRTFVSQIIEDEIGYKTDLDSILPIIYAKLNDSYERQSKLLPRCDHCSEFVHDPVRLPSGELVDRNCIDIFDKIFSSFASPITDMTTLNRMNQVEYTISVAIYRKTPNRTSIFSYSTTFGQKIGYVVQSLIERYPEISSYQFFSESGTQIGVNCQDVIGRISGIYVIRKNVHKDKIILKTDKGSEKSVKIQPWWMFYHLFDYFHTDIKEYSYVRVTLRLQNNHEDSLRVESSKFIKSLSSGIKCVKIKQSHFYWLLRDIQLPLEIKDLYVHYLNHLLSASDKCETLVKSDAYTFSNEGIAQIMSNNKNVRLNWNQSQDKICNLWDALEFAISHSNGYQTIIIFLLTNDENDSSFVSLNDIVELRQKIMVFIPNCNQLPRRLNLLKQKFPININIFNLYDYHDEINKLFF